MVTLNRQYAPNPIIVDLTEFPTSLQAGIIKRVPQWEHGTVQMAGGMVRRTQLWFNPRIIFDVTVQNADRAYVQLLEEFYHGVMGDLYDFLFQDWSNPNPVGQVIGRGNGVQTNYKIHGDAFDSVQVYLVNPALAGQASLQRVLQAPASVAPTTGIITMATPPAAGTFLSADIVNEKHRVTFHGFTKKHVHGIGYLPMIEDHQGGEAWRIEWQMMQIKPTT